VKKEVVMLIASGFSCRKVASKLGIAFNTARADRYNAMVKMKVNNVSSLLHAAIRLGLIEPPQP
jgi:DNA-binding CsgD family transcriptional regulator